MSRTAVLGVASEIYPLVKTGGLADVVGALPGALAGQGFDVTTLVPGYPAVLAGLGGVATVHHFDVLFGAPARLMRGRTAGLDILALDAPHLFARAGNPYSAPSGHEWPDNAERFAALAFAAAEIGHGAVGGLRPAIVHAHDWQAGLAPAYLHFRGDRERPRTLMTIHNLAFQGQFPPATFPRLGLPASAYATEGVEYYGSVGYLKAGLYYADAISTVSPAYAAEIRTDAGGMGLGGLLRTRAADLHGIVNGIDTAVWDPAGDDALAAAYDADRLDHRAANRAAIEARFDLEPGEGPLFIVVSRLTWQKGMDLLLAALPELVAAGGRLAVLGSGEPGLEAGFRDAVRNHPGRVGAMMVYDERLSHLLQGGADAILVPSRFEPCGLTQLYALRYGCVPVVSRVGGLADTVIDANDAAVTAGVATGIQFAPTHDGLSDGLARTFALHADRAAWRRMQRCGMAQDLSWERRAAGYAAVYRRLLAAPA
jgi:starch synthase